MGKEDEKSRRVTGEVNLGDITVQAQLIVIGDTRTREILVDDEMVEIPSNRKMVIGRGPMDEVVAFPYKPEMSLGVPELTVRRVKGMSPDALKKMIEIGLRGARPIPKK
jgi:hypothetical protein